VLDVGERGELSGGVIENSVRIPLGEAQSRTDELDRDKLLVVHCKGGYRSSITTSLLKRAGFRDIANLPADSRMESDRFCFCPSGQRIMDKLEQEYLWLFLSSATSTTPNGVPPLTLTWERLC
jgi:rhodanese-related sulfurtransferase